MTKANRHLLTFAQLDRELGLAELPPASDEEFPLPAWYRSVRDVPLEQLSTEDICKACRQRIHLSHIVPLATEKLREDPLTGEFYDGELIASLSRIDVMFWNEHPEEARNIRDIIHSMPRNDDPELQNDVANLLSNTQLEL